MPDAGPRADQPLVDPAGHLDALARVGQRRVDVAAVEQRLRPVEQHPREALVVVAQAGRLQRAVEQVDRRLETAVHRPAGAEDGVQRRKQLPVARPPGERHRALGVPRRVGEAVEVELGGGEVGGGVRAAGELVVGQVVDGGRGDGERGLRGGDVGRPRPGQGPHGVRRRAQRRIAQRVGFVAGAGGPGLHRRELHAVEAVDREVDRQRDRLGRPRRHRGTGRLQPRRRLLVAAHEPFDGGAGERRPDQQVGRVRRGQLDGARQR
ncbi:MAG TPA: hypothetical protein VF533_16750, partial [Solirubrobacteraceae bacterium]